MSLINWLRSLARRLSRAAAPRSRARRTFRCAALGLERLEDRTVPSFTASLSGGVVTFTSSTAGDSLVLSVDANGNLMQNRFGVDPGFASALDLDTSTSGVQSLNIANLTQLNVTTPSSGSLDLTGLLYLGNANLHTGTLFVAADVNMTLTNTSLTLAGGGNYTLSAVTSAHLFSGPSGNILDASAFSAGAAALIGGIGNDTLKGGAGTNFFTGGGGNDVLIGGSGTNTVVETADADFTLTNTLLSIGSSTETLTNIQRANLTGGPNSHNFTVSGWTGGVVTLTGGGGTDTVVCASDTNMTLTNTALTLASGPAFSLNGINSAQLTGGAGNNILDASAFTLGGVTLDGAGGNNTLKGGTGNDLFIVHSGNDTVLGGGGTDTVKATNDANMTLINTKLTIGTAIDTLTGISSAILIASGTNNDTLDASAFTLGSVSLFGNTGNNILKGGTVSNTFSTGGGSDTIIGQGSNNTITEGSDVNYILANNSLTEGGVVSSLTDIQNAILIGGASNNLFEISGWTGTASLIGSGGMDSVFCVRDANFTLTNTALTVSSGGSFNLVGIGTVQLGGGPSANTFTVSNWTGAATLDGVGGNDVYNVTFQGSGLGSVNISDSGVGNTANTVNVTGPATATSLVVTSGSVTASTGEMVTFNNTQVLNVNTGAGSDAVAVQSVAAGTVVTVNGGNGNNAYTIASPSNTLDGFAGTLHLNVGTGTNYLNVNDSASNINESLAVTSQGVFFTNRSFTIMYQAATGGTFANGINVQTGSGADGVTVISTLAGGPTIVSAGAGNDSISVSNSQNALTTLAGALYVDGGAGSNYLGIDESNATTADTVVLQVGSFLSTNRKFTIYDFCSTSGTFGSGLNLLLGSGVDVVSVLGSIGGATTYVNEGAGNDVTTVSSSAGLLNTYFGTFFVDGGAGSNTLTMSEASATTADNLVFTSTYLYSNTHPLTLFYLATGGTFGGGMNLLTGSGNDTLSLLSTAAGALTAINTGAGNDAIFVSSSTGTLNTFSGALYLDAGTGKNTLYVSEANAAINDNLYVTASAIFSSVTNFAFTFTATSGTFGGGVSLVTGSGNSNLAVVGQPASSPMTIQTGGGTNTVTVAATSSSGYSGLYLAFGSGLDYLFISAAGATTQNYPSGTGAGTYGIFFSGGLSSFIGYINTQSITRIA